MTIRVGSNTRDRGGVQYNVISNEIHPDYDWFTLDYDVALLRVSVPITLTNSIQPIALLATGSDDIPDGALLRVSGYGQTQVAADDQTLLRAVTVPKISNERCKEKYAAYVFPVNDNMLCAGFTEGGQDACQGDSGGALVNEAGEAVGVVSWGIGCARPGYPGVYARISSVRDFISSKINS